MKAIIFDLDDTLLRDDLTISQRTLDTLRRASERGIHIIPASGRARDSMKPFVEQIGCAALYVSCNGAEIWSPKHELLLREVLDVPLAQEIARFGKANACYAQTYDEHRFYYNERGAWADSYAKSSMLSGVCVGDLEQYLTASTTKILMMAEEKKIARMLQEARVQFAGRVSVTCSKPYFLEFNPMLATKGQALKRCGDLLGFTPQEAVAFGDSLNDLSMLQAAGCGVAMGNARPDVKALIPTHCPSNMEDGVAQWVEQHVLSSKGATA